MVRCLHHMTICKHEQVFGLITQVFLLHLICYVLGHTPAVSQITYYHTIWYTRKIFCMYQYMCQMTYFDLQSSVQQKITYLKHRSGCKNLYTLFCSTVLALEKGHSGIVEKK